MYAPSEEYEEVRGASMPHQAAGAMCRMLVESDLDFDRLHEMYNENGLPDLELALRTAFLHKMVGQNRAVVDQVINKTKIDLFLKSGRIARFPQTFGDTIPRIWRENCASRFEAKNAVNDRLKNHI
jgi:hypothetical protein